NGSPFEVVKSVVLPGSTLTPYVFDRSGNEVTGVTYEGCDAMKTTADVKVYKRPDGTEYKEPIGTGTPVGPIFACTVTAAPYWKLQSTSNSSGQVSVNFGNCGNKSVTRRTSTGYYKGFRPVSREDGQNFVQESSAIKTASYSATQGGSCSYEEVNQGSESRYRWFFGRGGVPGYPTPTATLYTQSAWDSAEGW
ncbi:hypothetical protein, partial [Kiloniella laminariae]|uniref:hypothetical protein n=1 Tax=Kiloniella laminariae TaxID=454162 RepID=UPI000526A982